MSGMDLPLVRVLDVLCPMHAVLNRTGHIVHAGPTLNKLGPGGQADGIRFLELLELKRPRIGRSLPELLRAAGTRLHVKLRHPPRTELKGVLVPLPDGTGIDGGALVNLSFGISVLEAVKNFSLTSSDFAATDLAIEMLYLVEAKSAAMAASRKLNTRLQGARIAAEEQAFTDTLTGLKNRRAMEHVLGRMTRTGQDFALMHLDLDYFKAVNDTMGHAAGDHILQQAARIMVGETRKNDAVVRTGGDEFVLIFKGLTDSRDVTEIGVRLIARLEEPILFDGKACHISASAGSVLSCDYRTADPVRMMEDADAALYAAKAAGRGRHLPYAPGIRGGYRRAQAAGSGGGEAGDQLTQADGGACKDGGEGDRGAERQH